MRQTVAVGVIKKVTKGAWKDPSAKAKKDEKAAAAKK
jgi:hypothetical protein